MTTLKYPTQRGSLNRVMNSTIKLLILVQLCLCAIETTNASSDGLDLSLGLTGSLTASREADEKSEETAAATIMNMVMSDDCSDEFSLTGQSIEFLSKALEEFASRERINPNDEQTSGRSISSWLIQAVGGPEKLAHLKGSLVEKQAIELDYVFKTFHYKFKPLINKLVTERPLNLNEQPNLAFRCERAEELKELKSMTSDSALLSILFDVFSNELYQHCLRRKLAQIKVSNIKPSSIVKQFVDIYLNVPPSYSRAALTETAASDTITEQITSGLAANFQLAEAIKSHGPLEQSAELVLDFSGADSKSLINKFKIECQQHTSQLIPIWSSFDQLAGFLSTPTNNLAEFNQQIKVILPQLVYSAVCAQLATSSS